VHLKNFYSGNAVLYSVNGTRLEILMLVRINIISLLISNLRPVNCNRQMMQQQHMHKVFKKM